MNRLLTIALALLMLAGCASGIHFISNPMHSQVIRVASGDRIFFDLPEDPERPWDSKSDDDDAEVFFSHSSDGRELSVTIRIHRGYDGPSTVEFFRLDKDGKRMKEGAFTYSLFKRIGDVAGWE